MKIKTLIEFAGVPKGTTGEAEVDHEATWSKEKVYKVLWDLPNFINVITGKPIYDWFNQKEFDDFLEVTQ